MLYCIGTPHTCANDNTRRFCIMKKLLSLVLALALCLVAFGAVAEPVTMDKLTLQFVPSKDADVIITGTKNLPQLLQALLPLLPA